MSNPVTYAEETLGVHKIYDEALAIQSELDTLMTDLDKVHDKRRDTELRLTDREMEIFFDERSTHTEMSATALDQHVKLVRHKDEDHQLLRSQLNALRGEVGGLEIDVDFAKARLRTVQVRMEQLGGYLNFLAAAKNAQTANAANAAPQGVQG